MKEHFEQIRQLLNELEEQTASGAVETSDRDFSALELPLIIQEIVDDLQPLLTPYEAAFYWHFFRHSIGEIGKQLLRVGKRGLQTQVVKSFRRDSDAGQVALETVSTALRGLESIGAIRKEGEPNQDGTPYRVLIPDEIAACRKFRAERTVAEPKAEVTESEADYYNVRENRIKVYERDEYKCRYCRKQLTRFTATIDHVKPIVEGGDNSFGNLVTACLDCNSRKNKRPLGDFLAEE